MPDFLLEVGLEEIPAGMVAAGERELARRVGTLLERERLAGEGFAVTSYSTPRRLAVLVTGLLDRQEDREEQVVGPSVAVAYKNGAPTPAAAAFAKKSGVEVSALITVTNAKGEYVAATVRRAGRSAAEVLSEMLPGEIGGIGWPKNMYWRAGKPERFVRPVRWLVALLDGDVLSLEVAGVWAGRESRGHRVLHGAAPVAIAAPGEYAGALRAAFVEVDSARRREKIRKAMDKETRGIAGARWREDEALVETVTHLTEWPSVILGGFDAGYLTLPDEVLVTVMRDHQKYFALEDGAGKLLPNFLAVLNVETDAAGAAIIRHGNERVLRARFNDAQFFWDVDQKIPLDDRVEMLKSVTFQKDLGSYWTKSERNLQMAGTIVEIIGTESEVLNHYGSNGNVYRAASLAKADLTTEMVKEFPELQGVIGGLYSSFQGSDIEVSTAIYDQYKPASPKENIPRTKTACIVALADKCSTVTDMFCIGLQPTGSKDPHALRRAGMGIIRIVVENAEIGSKLHLYRLSRAAVGGDRRDSRSNELVDSVFNFLLDRFEHYLQEYCEIAPVVSRAVRNSVAAGRYEIGGNIPPGYSLVAGFAKTLNKNLGSENVVAVAELLKRTSNILRQAREKQIPYDAAERGELLVETAEIELAQRVTEANGRIQETYRAGKYDETIAAIAALQKPLNDFFDSVMVMVDDVPLRNNRLALLARTEATVRWAADFSELASL